MTYSFSDNIQRGIIYLAKSDKEFLVQCDPIVRSSYFEFPQHQRMWGALSGYYKSYGTLPTDEAILEEIQDRLEKNLIK